MLTIRDLTVSFGATVILHPLSLTLQTGQSTTLLGRNGAGKTTFVRALAGLVASRGHIEIDSVPINTAPAAERARLIGYVSQDFLHQAGGLTVHEILLLSQSGGRRGWTVPKDDLRRAEETLAMLGLMDLAHRPIGAMSGGQRQMVALATALVRAPKVLLLDEPTSALDLANQLRMLEAVAEYTHTHNVTTLMILHDLNLAARFSDRMLLLSNGAILEDGAPTAVITHGNIAQVYGVDCNISHHSEGWPIIYAHHAL